MFFLYKNIKIKMEIYNDVDIEDKYIIDEDSILGEGITAVVRKAINIETGQEYAIKFIDT